MDAAPKTSLLERVGLHRPELRAWAMYDWANSAMVTTIITAVFPIYYANVAAAGLDPKTRTGRFALITTVGLLLSAVLGPVLGAVADFSATRKRMLGAFMLLGAGAVAAMFFVERGDWMLASALFMLANIGANTSFVFYDALLPHVARDDEVDRVSTAGYALGYLGGGLILALNLAWILKPGWFGLPSGPGLTPSQATLPSRLAFLSVAIWWVVFSIPLFRTVPEPPRSIEPGERRGGNPIAASFARLGETARELGRYKQALLMMVAFLAYNDGIGTIMRMATIYGDEIGLPQGALISAILLVQFVGIPFAFLFGHLAGRFGPKASILFSLGVYGVISILAYAMTQAWEFFALAILVGMVQGGSQALSRSLFASMIPRDKSGEFFGFFSVTEKFAGIFGPGLFWLSSLVTGSSRTSILSVLVFFVVGGALLWRVDIDAGRRAAREEDARDRLAAA